MQDPYCHSSSVLVERPAEIAFEIVADGVKQGSWAWGSAERSEVEPGLFFGRSIFTGRPSQDRRREMRRDAPVLAPRNAKRCGLGAIRLHPRGRDVHDQRPSRAK